MMSVSLSLCKRVCVMGGGGGPAQGGLPGREIPELSSEC